MYRTFVKNISDMETPSLSDIVTSRQQFIDEQDTNVLQDQLIRALGPFVDQVEDEHIAWWGLVMCSLFEIQLATKELGIW